MRKIFNNELVDAFNALSLGNYKHISSVSISFRTSELVVEYTKPEESGPMFRTDTYLIMGTDKDEYENSSPEKRVVLDAVNKAINRGRR